MEKEDILNGAQNERIKGSEFENRIGVRSSLIGFLTALFVGTILCLVELFVKKTLNFGLIALLFTTAGVQFLYEGIKTKSVWRIIFGAVELVLAVFFILGFIWTVIS